MKDSDELVEISHSINCPYFLDYPFRISIIGGSGIFQNY